MQLLWWRSFDGYSLKQTDRETGFIVGQPQLADNTCPCRSEYIRNDSCLNFCMCLDLKHKKNI